MVFHYLTFSLEENLKKLIENSFLVSDSSRSKLLKQLHRQLAEPSQSTAPTVPHAPLVAGPARPTPLPQAKGHLPACCCH